ncbi:hypothetical protein [Fodinicola feengrottensis]|uniref:hypothetical protein n=1 Tax=Fodinicola feengrottensis TaxID=435914 RepID=UPI0013D12352|nr:hypothetical protein [Fodinicola feengrottensis]
MPIAAITPAIASTRHVISGIRQASSSGRACKYASGSAKPTGGSKPPRVWPMMPPTIPPTKITMREMENQRRFPVRQNGSHDIGRRSSSRETSSVRAVDWRRLPVPATAMVFMMCPA